MLGKAQRLSSLAPDDNDANDFLYAVSAFRNYDPAGKLETIQTTVKSSKFVLLPASEQTHDHGTHTWAAVWQQYLKDLMDRSAKNN